MFLCFRHIAARSLALAGKIQSARKEHHVASERFKVYYKDGVFRPPGIKNLSYNCYANCIIYSSSYLASPQCMAQELLAIHHDIQPYIGFPRALHFTSYSTSDCAPMCVKRRYRHAKACACISWLFCARRDKLVK